MAFLAPSFNLLCDIYQNPAVPPAGPPVFVNIPCQLYYNSRQIQIQFQNYYHLRLPTGSVPGMQGGAALTQWWAEVPAGSGKFFQILEVEIVHMGFPNEYWCATMFEVQLIPAYARISTLP
jgi:hypothetical protein